MSACIKFRYARLYSSGNSVNAGNHIVQFQFLTYENSAYINRSNGKTCVDSNGKTTTIPTSGNTTDTGVYYDFPSNPGYLSIDLGAVYTIQVIKLWMYWGDYRKYFGTRIDVSVDNVKWYTIVDDARSASEYYTSSNPMAYEWWSDAIVDINKPLSLKDIDIGCRGGGTLPISLNEQRFRVCANKPSGPISFSDCMGVMGGMKKRQRFIVSGNNTHPANRQLTSPRSARSSDFTFTTIGSHAPKDGPERIVTGSWVIHVAEYLKYDDTTNSSYYVGQILSTWYDGTYQYQTRVTRVTSWYNGSNYTTYYDVYCVDEKRTYDKYQEYQGYLYINM